MKKNILALLVYLICAPAFAHIQLVSSCNALKLIVDKAVTLNKTENHILDEYQGPEREIVKIEARDAISYLRVAYYRKTIDYKYILALGDTTLDAISFAVDSHRHTALFKLYHQNVRRALRDDKKIIAYSTETVRSWPRIINVSIVDNQFRVNNLVCSQIHLPKETIY